MTSPTEIRAIVCTLDLASSASQGLTDWSAVLARRLGAELCLFHAIAPRADQLHPTAEFEHGGGLRDRRQFRLEQLQSLVRNTQGACNAEVAVGEPAEALEGLCRRRAVDLVVAGSQSMRGFKRLLMGTVVERLAHRIPCPILFLRPRRLRPIEVPHLGICCDLSSEDRHLIQYGQALARAFGSRIHLLHAMEAAVDDAIVDSTQGPYQETQQVLLQRLERKLLAREKGTPHPAAAVQAHILPGSVKFELWDVADELQLDLLIIGVRRRSLVGKLMMGSSTDAALRRAGCHVLTVPLAGPARAAAAAAGVEPGGMPGRKKALP